MDGQKNWMVRWIEKRDGWLDEWIEQNRWMVREKNMDGQKKWIVRWKIYIKNNMWMVGQEKIETIII